jgi:hypothetical protein
MPLSAMYLIVQIDTGGIQTALLAFIASSSTSIRRSVCILPGSLPPPNEIYASPPGESAN